MISIGLSVSVSALADKEYKGLRNGHQITWVSRELDKPRIGYVTGMVRKFNGRTEWGYPDTPDTPTEFRPTKSIELVCIRFGIFNKEVYAFEKDVEVLEHETPIPMLASKPEFKVIK